jgi:hypothetical protein
LPEQLQQRLRQFECLQSGMLELVPAVVRLFEQQLRQQQQRTDDHPRTGFGLLLVAMFVRLPIKVRYYCRKNYHSLGIICSNSNERDAFEHKNAWATFIWRILVILSL